MNIDFETLDNVSTLIIDGSKKLATKNLIPGIRGEKTIMIGDEEYRIWDPYHSKLAAIILSGSSISIKKDSTMLYLGAANGTTVSHVSDIVKDGTVFAVEFSPRAMQDLIRISTPRMNLIPVFADAQNPELYKNIVSEVDIIYQDIAQRDQARIAIKNASIFLKNDGLLVLIIKSRSINSIKKTDEVVDSEIKKLVNFFDIKEVINLEPFHLGHKAVIARKSFIFDKRFYT